MQTKLCTHLHEVWPWNQVLIRLTGGHDAAAHAQLEVDATHSQQGHLRAHAGCNAALQEVEGVGVRGPPVLQHLSTHVTEDELVSA
eukprot:scaffold100246_cov19-Tisochrysis_lutea.AAC.1